MPREPTFCNNCGRTVVLRRTFRAVCHAWFHVATGMRHCRGGGQTVAEPERRRLGVEKGLLLALGVAGVVWGAVALLVREVVGR